MDESKDLKIVNKSTNVENISCEVTNKDTGRSTEIVNESTNVENISWGY